MSFIRRHGRKQGVLLAKEEVPSSLRVGFVNLLDELQYHSGFPSLHGLHEDICRALRNRPYRPADPLGAIEYVVGSCAWDDFYEICETVARALPIHMEVRDEAFPRAFSAQGLPLPYEVVKGLSPPRLVPHPTAESFLEDLNDLLEEEGVPWRMIDREIVPAFPHEASEILDDAAQAAKQLDRPGVAVHLEKARRHLSPSNADPENAVKEAVSAVEAAVKEKARVSDLDEGLRLLKQQRRLSPHWSAAIQTLFQYASREDQIRHGSPEVSDLTFEGARDVVGLAAVLTQHIAGLPDPR